MSYLVRFVVSRLVVMLTGEHPAKQDHDADVKAQWDKLSQDEKV